MTPLGMYRRSCIHWSHGRIFAIDSIDIVSPYRELSVLNLRPSRTYIHRAEVKRRTRLAAHGEQEVRTDGGSREHVGPL